MKRGHYRRKSSLRDWRMWLIKKLLGKDIALIANVDKVTLGSQDLRGKYMYIYNSTIIGETTFKMSKVNE